MNNLLSKLLQKRGIKDYSELSEEEQKQFDNWQKTLSKDELENQDIKKFCQHQLIGIGVAFEDLEIDQRKQDKLVAQHAVYSALVRAIDAPKAEREQIEQYLTNLLK